MEPLFSNQAATSDEKEVCDHVILDKIRIHEQTGWYDLPYEMRIMIIDMMDEKSRGNLSSCSKLCCQEVRRSKDFINEITVRDGDIGTIRLIIEYPNYASLIRFSKITDNDKEKCLISNETLNSVKYSRYEKKVDGSMEDIALEHFNRFVNDAIHLKEITVESNFFRFDKTSIRHLTKLETIKIKKNSSINLLGCGFLSINQLVSASKTVKIEGTIIEIDQLINFKASEITLRPFSLSQLNQYLKLWENNQIQRNVKKLQIPCSYCVPDDLVSGLEVLSREEEFGGKCIKIRNNVGKVASIEIFMEMIIVEFDVFYVPEFTSREDDSDDNEDYYNRFYDSDDS